MNLLIHKIMKCKNFIAFCTDIFYIKIIEGFKKMPSGHETVNMDHTNTDVSKTGHKGVCDCNNQVEDNAEILIRYNVWGRGPKFWTGT